MRKYISTYSTLHTKKLKMRKLSSTSYKHSSQAYYESSYLSSLHKFGFLIQKLKNRKKKALILGVSSSNFNASVCSGELNRSSWLCVTTTIIIIVFSLAGAVASIKNELNKSRDCSNTIAYLQEYTNVKIHSRTVTDKKEKPYM